MINAIIGDIIDVQDQEVIIRGGAVEYTLIVSGQTASRLGSLRGEQKDNVRIFTVLLHRQDLMVLYGFADEMEREAFNQLQSVNGIGPKQALKILSGINVENLAKALDEGNLKLLSSVPGIGPKTGQKMILQLRNVLILDEEKTANNRHENSKFSEVISGLSEMGYERRTLEDAVAKIETQYKDEIEKLSLHDQEEFVFKHVLRYLG